MIGTAKRIRIARLFVRALPAMALIALSLSAAPGWTQQKPAPKPAPAAQQPRPSAGGMHQGITVHGRWVIEVKNPDGTVVSRREFENKLEQPWGADTLVQILSGEGGPGGFIIGLPVPCAGADFCILSQPGKAPVTLLEIASDLQYAFQNTALECQGAPAGACLQTLSVTVPGSPEIVLSGSVVASASGSIGAVETAETSCNTNVTVAACGNGPGTGGVYAFTGTTLTPAQSFSEGQTITVTVTFSFM
jgi:hypothetical protein